MPTIITPDGTNIFYKDWGPKAAQPIVFHHGWPLSADDWDNQLMFFLGEGFRVIAHDRRGHGRSTQTEAGNDMDTYVEDVKALVSALDLQNAIHVGHSTGGGEVAHYVPRAQPGRVVKAHYDCIKAFSETDFTEDLRSIDVPVLLLHGDDDQVVPIADSALIGITLLKHGRLKVYPGYPHGMATTHADEINKDILAFI